jgi:hypothetical protein
MGDRAQDIRGRIAARRARIGEIVEAIAYRSDAKARSRDAVGRGLSGTSSAVLAAADVMKLVRPDRQGEQLAGKENEEPKGNVEPK